LSTWRRRLSDQLIDQYSKLPYVNFLILIFLRWLHYQRRPLLFPRFDFTSMIKLRQHNPLVIGYPERISCYSSVHELLRMHMAQRTENLLANVFQLSFSQLPRQTQTTCVFQDRVNLVSILVNLKNFLDHSCLLANFLNPQRFQNLRFQTIVGLNQLKSSVRVFQLDHLTKCLFTCFENNAGRSKVILVRWVFL
jgi:hypothetical protein